MPCSFNDHFANLRDHNLTADAHGENLDAKAMKSDPAFAKILRKYDEELKKLTQRIFEEEYPEGKAEGVWAMFILIFNEHCFLK